MDETLGGSDYLLINHREGREEKKFIPPVMTRPIRIGRETDNDVILTDPRASRHHAQIRRSETGVEIMDAGSANGILVNGEPIQPNVWHLLPQNALVYVGDTTLTYKPRIDIATTLAMAPVSSIAGAPEEPPSRQPRNLTPWLLMLGGVILIAALVVVAVLLWPSGGPSQIASEPSPTSDVISIVDKATGESPTTTMPEGTEDQVQRIPYPVMEVEGLRVEPIILGALPDPNKAFIIVDVRVENQGTGDFTLSSDQFELLDASGTVLNEVGITYSQDGLRKLGLTDRFQNLRVGPGDSVPESLLFSGEAIQYQFMLRYQPPGMESIVVDLGPVNAQREVALALGTLEADEEPLAMAAEPTPTLEPTPTATRPAALPVPQRVPAASLVGRIAYPVFNGETYDIYIADLETSENNFFLSNASQPQFSPDGQRIAYHSWQKDKRGLITQDVAGGNEHFVGSYLEDQLPTWSPDGSIIILLSRRSGQRASELYRTSATSDDAQFIGNGEYPTWALDGMLAFKGWESTGVGLRLADPTDMSELVTLSDDSADTAPAVSPDGKQIAFMSQRDGDWNIYVVNSDGTDLKQLTDDPADDGLPAWSPDGKAIAFVSSRGGPWAVWAMSPEGNEGSGKRQLFTLEGSPDGFVAGEDLDKSRGWAEERISWTR